MRQFANVSISPWTINPYTGATTNPTKSPYQSALTPQPLYRRIILPPAPVFYHPDVEQVVEPSDDDDEEAGPSGAPLSNHEAIVQIPQPPSAPAAHPPAENTSPPPASEETEQAADATPESPPAAASPGADGEGEAEPTRVEEPAEPVAVKVENEAFPGAGIEQPASVEQAEEAAKNGAVEASGDPEPDEGSSFVAVDVACEAVLPEDPSAAESDKGGIPVTEEATAAAEMAESVPTQTPECEPITEPSPLAQPDGPPTAEAEESGESEPAAPQSPKPAVEKSVHFSPDVKDPDAHDGNKIKDEAKKGKSGKAKAKPNAFIRIKPPPPVPAPQAPKEDKKKAVDRSHKKKNDKEPSPPSPKEGKKKSPNKEEKKKVAEQESTSPVSPKKRLSKAEERKKKKEEKNKKGKEKKSDKTCPGSTVSVDSVPIGEGDAKSDVPESAGRVEVSEARSAASEAAADNGQPPAEELVEQAVADTPEPGHAAADPAESPAEESTSPQESERVLLDPSQDVPADIPPEDILDASQCSSPELRRTLSDSEEVPLEPHAANPNSSDAPSESGIAPTDDAGDQRDATQTAEVAEEIPNEEEHMIAHEGAPDTVVSESSDATTPVHYQTRGDFEHPDEKDNSEQSVAADVDLENDTGTPVPNVGVVKTGPQDTRDGEEDFASAENAEDVLSVESAESGAVTGGGSVSESAQPYSVPIDAAVEDVQVQGPAPPVEDRVTVDAAEASRDSDSGASGAEEESLDTVHDQTESPTATQEPSAPSEEPSVSSKEAANYLEEPLKSAEEGSLAGECDAVGSVSTVDKLEAVVEGSSEIVAPSDHLEDTQPYSEPKVTSESPPGILPVPNPPNSEEWSRGESSTIADDQVSTLPAIDDEDGPSVTEHRSDTVPAGSGQEPAVENAEDTNYSIIDAIETMPQIAKSENSSPAAFLGDSTAELDVGVAIGTPERGADPDDCDVVDKAAASKIENPSDCTQEDSTEASDVTERDTAAPDNEKGDAPEGEAEQEEEAWSSGSESQNPAENIRKVTASAEGEAITQAIAIENSDVVRTASEPPVDIVEREENESMQILEVSTSEQGDGEGADKEETSEGASGDKNIVVPDVQAEEDTAEARESGQPDQVHDTPEDSVTPEVPSAPEPIMPDAPGEPNEADNKPPTATEDEIEPHAAAPSGDSSKSDLLIEESSTAEPSIDELETSENQSEDAEVEHSSLKLMLLQDSQSQRPQSHEGQSAETEPEKVDTDPEESDPADVGSDGSPTEDTASVEAEPNVKIPEETQPESVQAEEILPQEGTCQETSPQIGEPADDFPTHSKIGEASAEVQQEEVSAAVSPRKQRNTIDDGKAQLTEEGAPKGPDEQHEEPQTEIGEFNEPPTDHAAVDTPNVDEDEEELQQVGETQDKMGGEGAFDQSRNVEVSDDNAADEDALNEATPTEESQSGPPAEPVHVGDAGSSEESAADADQSAQSLQDESPPPQGDEPMTEPAEPPSPNEDKPVLNESSEPPDAEDDTDDDKDKDANSLASAPGQSEHDGQGLDTVLSSGEGNDQSCCDVQEKTVAAEEEAPFELRGQAISTAAEKEEASSPQGQFESPKEAQAPEVPTLSEGTSEEPSAQVQETVAENAAPQLHTEEEYPTGSNISRPSGGADEALQAKDDQTDSPEPTADTPELDPVEPEHGDSSDGSFDEQDGRTEEPIVESKESPEASKENSAEPQAEAARMLVESPPEEAGKDDAIPASQDASSGEPESAQAADPADSAHEPEETAQESVSEEKIEERQEAGIPSGEDTKETPTEDGKEEPGPSTKVAGSAIAGDGTGENEHATTENAKGNAADDNGDSNSPAVNGLQQNEPDDAPPKGDAEPHVAEVAAEKDKVDDMPPLEVLPIGGAVDGSSREIDAVKEPDAEFSEDTTSKDPIAKADDEEASEGKRKDPIVPADERCAEEAPTTQVPVQPDADQDVESADNTPHLTEEGVTSRDIVKDISEEPLITEKVMSITPPNGTAKVDDSKAEGSPETPSKEKHRRRHSHSHRDGKHHSHHSNKRRESNASTAERPTLNSMALLAAAKFAGSARRRRDSITEKESTRDRVRVRDFEIERLKGSSSRDQERKERSLQPGDRVDDKERKRQTLQEKEDNIERRKRHEARRAERVERERIARDGKAARIQAEEEARKRRREERLQGEEEARRKRREERRAQRMAEEERVKLLEEERNAKEEEARRTRHEERRKRHEAEKEARRLERERTERAEREEQEARRVRRQRRVEREKMALAAKEQEDPERPWTHDAARRAAEEDEEVAPPTPVSPRAPVRRHTGERPREPPQQGRRNSLLGGIALFGRSRTEPTIPTSKPIKPVSRVSTDPTDEFTHRERPLSSHHSSKGSRERERHHRRHSHSHQHRQFKSAAEEEEYRARKEARRAARAAKEREFGMAGADDPGVTPPSHVENDAALPPDLVEAEPELDRPPSPFVDEAAAVAGAASAPSGERRRTSRRVSIVERERPNIRRVSVTEKERPVSRRSESDRLRTRSGDDRNRERPRRGENERSSRNKKKDESGFKGLFGGLKRMMA